MAILEPKQVAQSDFSAGLRAFESGANMITAALDKAAAMPGAWQKQMRQYRENEAAQSIMSAKNMEDILARSRAAAEAGATAYNPEGMKNLALLSNTQLAMNNQAAEERVQREFGDYEARIIQARNNGDRALENKLLNEYVTKRNQAAQESGLDYNQIKFGQYDYQANDLQRANLGLQRERLRWDMHQGLTDSAVNIAKSQAFADKNYDPNNSASVTAAWNEAINHALSTENPDAVARIVNEAVAAQGYNRVDPASETALREAQSFLSDGRNTPTSSNTPAFSQYNRNLPFQGALSDKYATSASSSGLIAASYPAGYPSSSTSSGSSTGGNPMTAGADAIRAELNRANQAQQAKEQAAAKKKAGEDAELQAAINTINNRQDGIIRNEKGEPIAQQQPTLTPQQQAQKQAMQAADEQLQAISAGSSEDVMAQAKQNAAQAKQEAEENFVKAAEKLQQPSKGQQNFQQALNQQQPQKPRTAPTQNISEELFDGSFISRDQQEGIDKFLKNTSEEDRQVFGNLATALQSNVLTNKKVATDLFNVVAKAGDAGVSIDFSDEKSVINALLRFDKEKYQVTADPYGYSQANATNKASKDAKLYTNFFRNLRRAEQAASRKVNQVDQAAMTAFSSNNLRLSSNPADNEKKLAAQRVATGSIKQKIERAKAINNGAIRNNPLMQAMQKSQVAVASGQLAEDCVKILVQGNKGENKDFDYTDKDSGVYATGGEKNSEQIFENDIRKSDTYLQIEAAFNTAGLDDHMRAEIIRHYAPRLIIESSDGAVRWDPDTVNEMMDMVQSTKMDDILVEYTNLSSQINKGDILISQINDYEIATQALHALNDEGAVVANNVATALPDTQLNSLIYAASQGDISKYREYATIAAERMYPNPYTARIAVNSACFKFMQYAKSQAKVIQSYKDIKDQIVATDLLVPIQELNNVR